MRISTADSLTNPPPDVNQPMTPIRSADLLYSNSVPLLIVLTNLSRSSDVAIDASGNFHIVWGIPIGETRLIANETYARA
jgi:hypothetical protein